MANQGGTHEQHVKAGQQSHKNMDNTTRNASSSGSREQQSSSSRGGTHEQHVKAGQQSHKNS
ncbi:hypothetical protein LJR251_003686 [Rhizobium rhizogenes]|jgi:hypothetical protein|uniref:hypothetical protein n=1 Tax=Rhizobium rhizogenes TaxID=359 RepID=UPI0006464506|nr:hypothetical protein [Rhizobium rhizogenes]